MFDATIFTADNERYYRGELINTATTGIITNAINRNGDVVAVAAPADGTVKLYTRSGDTWSIAQTITGSATNRFGSSVSMDTTGDYLVVGECFYDSTYTDQGRTHIYLRSGGTWSIQQTLESPATSQAWYGGAVDINGAGDTVAVGAEYANAAVSRLGAVYVYTRSGTVWSLQQSITLTVGGFGYEADRRFGRYVSLSSSGNDLAIAAPGLAGTADPPYTYVYTRSAGVWSQLMYDDTGSSTADLSDDGTKLCSGGVLGMWVKDGTPNWDNRPTAPSGTGHTISPDGAYVMVSGFQSALSTAGVYSWDGNNFALVQNIPASSSAAAGISFAAMAASQDNVWLVASQQTSKETHVYKLYRI